MDIALLVFCLLLMGGGIASLIIGLRGYAHSKSAPLPYKKDGLCILLGLLGVAIGFALGNGAIFAANPSWAEVTAWAEDTVFAGEEVNYSLYISLAIIFSFFFALSFSILWSNFYLHFKKEGFDAKSKKLNSYLLYGSIPLVVIFFCLFTSGYGPYMDYPLISGFQIGGEEGWAWVTAHRHATGGLHVAFYGIFIVFGVFVCYWISDHYFYKKYGKHGMLDLIAIIGFLFGVIGARVWYVVGNYEREFANADWTQMFAIWDGGLTILGGAAFGIVAGVITARIAKPNVDIRWGVDIIVPTILLAQAIGRIGNFFNCEVYGQVVSVDAWRFLPNWLLAQMGQNNGGGALDPGLIHVPLFLIEAILSVVGFFFLYVVVGKLLKRWTRKGDVAGAYFIWYGVVRAIMEPMRDQAFNMGTDNAWSVINSLGYILIGIAVILAFHLYDREKEKKSILPASCISILFVFTSLFLPFATSLTVTKGSNSIVANYDGYSLIFSGHAPINLAAWILALLALAAALLSLFFALKKKNELVKYTLYGAGVMSLISALLLFIGTGNAGISEVPGENIEALNFNLSYGFAIMASLLLVSLVPAAVYLFDTGMNYYHKIRPPKKGIKKSEEKKEEEVSSENV